MYLVPSTFCSLDKRAVSERPQLADRGACDGARRLPGEPSAEDRQRMHDRPLAEGEKLPGVVEHRPHTAVALRRAAQVALQEVQARP